MKLKFSDEQLRELHSKGLTIAQIAQELEVSIFAVKARSKRLNLPPNPYACQCSKCGKTFMSRYSQSRYCPTCRNMIKHNLDRALSEIDRITSLLTPSESIRETATAIYKAVCKERLTRGRPIKHSVAAAVYAACREHATPWTLKDIAKIAETGTSGIARSYRSIAHNLMLRSRPADPTSLVQRFCSELKLSDETRTRAISLLKEATEKGAAGGRGPANVAAATVYIATRMTGERRTQSDIADVAQITDVTLRNCCHELCKKLNLPWPCRKIGSPGKARDQLPSQEKEVVDVQKGAVEVGSNNSSERRTQVFSNTSLLA